MVLPRFVGVTVPVLHTRVPTYANRARLTERQDSGYREPALNVCFFGRE